MKIDFENSKKIYYSLKEVAAHFGEEPYLIRYWETVFETIKPRRTEGGTRQYTKEDILDIETVYHLIKTKGMTHEGAKQALESGLNEIEKKLLAIKKLEAIRDELNSISDAF